MSFFLFVDKDIQYSLAKPDSCFCVRV